MHAQSAFMTSYYIYIKQVLFSEDLCLLKITGIVAYFFMVLLHWFLQFSNYLQRELWAKNWYARKFYRIIIWSQLDCILIESVLRLEAWCCTCKLCQKYTSIYNYLLIIFSCWFLRHCAMGRHMQFKGYCGSNKLTPKSSIESMCSWSKISFCTCLAGRARFMPDCLF